MDLAASDHPMMIGLNPAQREAVLHVDGPLLVLAGAGSGKTRVLTTRIARLIQVHGVDPREILAVTFTNKAAGEMRERIARLLGSEPRGMWMGTFHAIGARMLRMAPQAAGRTASFTIYDQDDTQGVVKRVMERHRISPKQFAPRAVQSAISDAKNALTSPADYEQAAVDPFQRAVAAVYRDFATALQTANAVDFDDLLVLPVELLRDSPSELARYHARFRYILVDEYQDTNRAQYELVRLLGRARGNVCVVGDDDQSIYGWRGADIRNILDFNKDFPQTTTVRLEENYRSNPPILEVANAVILPNAGRMGKTLRATRSGGERVMAVRALHERDEAEWLAGEIAARQSRDHLALRDFAVLYRTNSQSRALEEGLRRRGTPYRIIGNVRFYDRREIRDVMSYLKLVANPADDEAFRRAVSVPRRGLGETTIDRVADVALARRVPMFDVASHPEWLEDIRPAARTALADFAEFIRAQRARAEDAAVDELLGDIVESIRYADYLRAEGPESAERLENVRELITGAAEVVADDLGEVGLRPLDHFLQRASLIADVDSLDADADAVTLMTLHNAKGLEFPVVFITGLEDGLFPLARAFDEPALLEEERRLLYVGVTRAERMLYLTFADERRRNGETMISKRSSFLDTIPEALVEQRSTVAVRSSGRSAIRGTGWQTRGGRDWGTSAYSRRDVANFSVDDDPRPSRESTARRAGIPVETSFGTAEEESQDAPIFLPGARVRHRKFGGGTIAELSGSGRQAKARIDFDDPEIGRKTLVIAQANLERGDDSAA